jgi:CRISPR-associated protein Cas1
VERETRLRVPLHHIGPVVCLGNVGLSTPLVHRLAEEGVSLVLLDGNGRFKARMEGPVSGNVLLRRAQHERSMDGAFALDTARCCVAGKIKNARQVLLRGAREAKQQDEAAQLSRSADDLAAALRALPTAGDLDTVRGVEGEAARQYFAGIALLVRTDAREHFRMDGRTRRPPRDRFNALLSFLYSMWMNDCRSALEGAGLDPQGWWPAGRHWSTREVPAVVWTSCCGQEKAVTTLPPRPASWRLNAWCSVSGITSR